MHQLHLVDAEVGVGRDDRPATEVDALAGEVSAETSLLALEALVEPAGCLLRLLPGRQACHFTVEVAVVATK